MICPDWLNARCYTGLKAHYPCPDQHRQAKHRSQRLHHLQPHPFLRQLLCPAPAASDANVLFHQLPSCFTPSICASTGSTLLARSSLIFSKKALSPIVPFPPVGVAECSFHTFSPIARRSGASKPEKARRSIGNNTTNVSAKSSRSQRSSARHRPSWCSNNSPLPYSTPSIHAAACAAGLTGESASRARRCNSCSSIAFCSSNRRQQRPRTSPCTPSRSTRDCRTPSHSRR